MSDKNKKLFYIASGSALVIVFALVLALTLFKNNGAKDFLVTSTTPADKEQNIKPQEILISFNTNKPVASADDYTIVVDPPVNYKLKLLSQFPTQTVSYQALGGLKTNTPYTVTITNNYTKRTTSWNFTTSGEIPESSSGAFNAEQEEIIADSFPLLEKTPYESANVSVVYEKELTLLVKIKTRDIEAAKKEVIDWITQQGVNPTTHTINYQNAF